MKWRRQRGDRVATEEAEDDRVAEYLDLRRGRGVFPGRPGAGDHIGSDDQVVDLSRRVIELPEPAEPAMSASERAACGDLGERLNWLPREEGWEADSPPPQGPAQHPVPPARSLPYLSAAWFVERNRKVFSPDASVPADHASRVHDLRHVHDRSRRDEDETTVDPSVEPVSVEPVAAAKASPVASATAAVPRVPAFVPRLAPSAVVDGAPPPRGRTAVWVAAVAGVAILAGLLAGALELASDDGSTRRDLAGRQKASGPAAPASAGLQEAMAWVGQHVRPGTQVVVPDGVAGPPGAVVTTYREAGSAEPTGLLVKAGEPPALVAALIDRSMPLATFGAGAGAVQVLDLSAAPRDQESRVQAGRDLLANTALDLDSGARAAVGAGQVDPRLLVLLAGLAARHTLTVELPMDPADSDAVRLQANITTYDGSPATASNPAVDRLTNWLREQPPPFEPDRVRQQVDAVAVQVLLPAEPGLLEIGSFQTVQPD